jgi:soluble lytic murein transglycosylase
MVRLAPLLAVACLGSGGVLVAARSGLSLLPGPDPDTPEAWLTVLQRWAPDPALRREASLLLLARRPDAPADQHRLLRSQGWGPDPLAAVVVKRDAQALEGLGEPQRSEALWRQLGRRFPHDPANADGLYALGRHRQLRSQFPAHPAALAAAQQAGDGQAALHLARWGVRWPGADQRLHERCSAAAVPAAERDLLARGLAQLGDGNTALSCLRSSPASPSTQLAIGRSLLAEHPDRAEPLLLQLARRHPDTAAATEATRLLSEGDSASSLAALNQLPAALQRQAPVAARRALERQDVGATLAVLQRWPEDPASWELQWQLARQALLQRRWSDAIALLGEPHASAQQPPLLASRRLFWLGLSRWQLGQRQAARSIWQQLLRSHPGGYYGWRAAERLGRGRLELAGSGQSLPRRSWKPLGSPDAGINRLWRLGQSLEAWEHWRHRRLGQPPTGPKELVLEGRLRRAVGDHWIGLGQLEQASLRVSPRQCRLAAALERHLHEPAWATALAAASRQAGVPAALLAGVAKQESRFSTAVRSPVGAIGLMQLMPDTAAELAGGPVEPAELEDASRNAELGARYLAQLLQRWGGSALLAVASYNAGPGAVTPWINAQLQQQPELWVEAIPYPETRLYVKKVLGNAWSFQQQRQPHCPP